MKNDDKIYPPMTNYRKARFYEPKCPACSLSFIDSFRPRLRCGDPWRSYAVGKTMTCDAWAAQDRGKAGMDPGIRRP
jgi:hypothetical protein